MEDQGRGKSHPMHSELQEHAPSNRFTAREEQLLVQVDNEPLYEIQINNYQRHAEQNLWFSFQRTASSIAQMYRDRLEDHDEGWTSFQNAAASATNLYKESVEISKTNKDLALQCGYQRRNKELLAWVKKRKRHIRREDLIGFLCGHSPPHRSGAVSRSSRQSPSHSGHSGRKSELATRDSDLHQFHEAISMQGLSGAMAGISVQGHPGSPSPRQQRRSPNSTATHRPGTSPDLANFVTGEIRRHRNDSSHPSTSAGRRRSRSPCHGAPPSRKRNPSSESSNSDCPSGPKKSRK